MHILIFPSKILGKKCALYTAKYGTFLTKKIKREGRRLLKIQSNKILTSLKYCQLCKSLSVYPAFFKAPVWELPVKMVA